MSALANAPRSVNRPRSWAQRTSRKSLWALAVGRSSANSSLLRLFPVLRENTGKFVEFRLGTTIDVHLRGGIQSLTTRIPYADQGSCSRLKQRPQPSNRKRISKFRLTIERKLKRLDWSRATSALGRPAADVEGQRPLYATSGHLPGPVLVVTGKRTTEKHERHRSRAYADRHCGDV